ncbi:TetR/AcrR family transcriptional regulator [Cohnella thermotolerans]|uniref:TetR/AcrR family transcriptional regulator n=1 Tax=Cohnella thermotolerans TaxID=329858 RepID=UPI0004111A93|nr:helix-turn-helix domain-containing protein [Cohnella thermotolerans]
MRRELKREQTLQLLLDTARQLIREKGCMKTTFSDIMERSGLSKGAIFHYVKGKDDLLGMLLRSGIEPKPTAKPPGNGPCSERWPPCCRWLCFI